MLAIVSVAMVMFAQTIGSSAKLDPATEETATATAAASQAIERIRNRSVDDIPHSFDDVASNDPGGSGTAPGAWFDVAGLAPVDSHSHVGHVVMPILRGRVREDFVDAKLGMPRDLNGDGVVDSLDHTNDWLVLPVRIHLEWLAKGGLDRRKRTFDIHTMIPRL